MKTKLIQKQKNGSNKEPKQKLDDEGYAYVNLEGVKEIVIRESVYEPVPVKYLKYFLQSGK